MQTVRLLLPVVYLVPNMSRGRGAGRAGSTFSLESMGFGRGDQLPQPILQPPPTFPPLGIDLPSNEPSEDDLYLIQLSQSLKEMIRASKHYIQEKKETKSIVKYSDKYESINEGIIHEQDISWDLRLFPKELHPNQKWITRKRVQMDVSPVLKNLESRILEEGIETIAPKTAIEVAEVTIKQEIGSDEEKDADDDLVDDEEINDEDTDYQNAYFDNGEDYLEGGGSDDNLDEGPTY